ncbi:6439_t:CDS:2, partial [Gigaspora margarita]
PSDLLEKEVWVSCSSPKEWWIKSIPLSRLLAVMSVIGYIIGLGARHLDNIMTDFECGEVIHIDCNVRFEKGNACKNVLRVLRENKEILITLLEAFMYYPLVDWHQNMSKDSEKQIMEIEESHLSNSLSEFLTVFKRIYEHYMNLYNQQVKLSEQSSQSRNTIEMRKPALIHNHIELESLKSALSQSVNE